jgi:putative ABC transport system permease protein
MDPAAKNPSSREREQIESRDPIARRSLFESSIQDLKIAFRSLRKSPGFAITAILTLALGIGVNASIFQLMDAVRLRSLPVAAPDRLASVEIRGGIHDFIPVRPSDLSFPLWEQIRDHQQAFSSVFAWRTNHVRVGQGIDERKAVALWFTGEAFNTLGISPEKGRFFLTE